MEKQLRSHTGKNPLAGKLIKHVEFELVRSVILAALSTISGAGKIFKFKGKLAGGTMNKLRWLWVRAVCILAIGTALVAGCGALPIDPITGAGSSMMAQRSLDDAISALERESSAWRSTLERLESQLASDVQSTLRTEVANLANEAVAAAGAEFRCNTDFIGVRVKESLVAMRARLVGDPTPLLNAYVCRSIPDAIDANLNLDRRNVVKLAGWNLERGRVTAMLVDATGSRDVSQHLDFPSRYLATLNLGGTGLALTRTNQRIEFRSNGHPLSQVAILHPAASIRALKFTFVNVDGARGGHTILPALVLRNGQRVQARERLDGGVDWPNNSTREASWLLPREVPLADVTGIEISFEDGDCFACQGDNWTVNKFKVELSEPAEFRRILLDLSGSPVFSFHMNGTWSRPL